MNRLEALEWALTPSSETKGSYSGEFFISVEQINPDYDENFDIGCLDFTSMSDADIGEIVRKSTSLTITYEHMISWTTIKEIMKTIKGYADGISTPDKN